MVEYAIDNVVKKYHASKPGYAVSSGNYDIPLDRQVYLFKPQAEVYASQASRNYGKQGMGQRWRAENQKLSQPTYH